MQPIKINFAYIVNNKHSSKLLKKCTTALPPKFLEELCDPHTGFNNKTIREILDYLFEIFGKASEGDVEKLEQVFIAPFDPLEPFGN